MCCAEWSNGRFQNYGKGVETQTHWFTFDEKSIESVAQAVTNLAIQFGDSVTLGKNTRSVPSKK